MDIEEFDNLSDEELDIRLSKMNWRPGQHRERNRKIAEAKKQKHQISLRLEQNILDYFQGIADETGITTQEAIRQCLNYSMNQKLRPTWAVQT